MSAVLHPLPTPTHEALVARAARLARDFAGQAAAQDRSGAAPTAQFAALRKAGLLGLTAAESLGGLGAGLVTARAVVGAVAQGDPSVALILAMHYNQQAAIGRSFNEPDGEWPAALARQLALESAGGQGLINAAQVEPALGSPSFGGLPATLATPVPGGWHLSGHKIYVTGAPLLSWITVLARTDEAEPRIGSFLVARDAPGVRIVETWDALGLRASSSHDVVFESVVVPADRVLKLRPARDGLVRDAVSTAWYFNLVGSVYDGVARSARDWLLSFLNERSPTSLGAPLASLPAVQEAVGRLEVKLASNDWLLRSHAQALDEDRVPDGLAGVVKHVVIDNAASAVQEALDLAGNHGLARRNPLERHHRDVQCARVHSPPNALIRTQLGLKALSAHAQTANQRLTQPSATP